MCVAVVTYWALCDRAQSHNIRISHSSDLCACILRDCLQKVLTRVYRSNKALRRPNRISRGQEPLPENVTLLSIKIYTQRILVPIPGHCLMVQAISPLELPLLVLDVLPGRATPSWPYIRLSFRRFVP